MEYPEGTIRLGAGECCAIAHAFAKNKDAVRALKDIGNPADLKATVFGLSSIRPPSLNYVDFNPKPETQIALVQMIAAELKRLEKTEPKFHCRHSKEDHISFLQSSQNKLKITIN